MFWLIIACTLGLGFVAFRAQLRGERRIAAIIASIGLLLAAVGITLDLLTPSTASFDPSSLRNHESYLALTPWLNARVAAFPEPDEKTGLSKDTFRDTDSPILYVSLSETGYGHNHCRLQPKDVTIHALSTGIDFAGPAENDLARPGCHLDWEYVIRPKYGGGQEILIDFVIHPNEISPPLVVPVRLHLDASHSLQREAIITSVLIAVATIIAAAFGWLART